MITVKQLRDIIQAEYDDDAMCQALYAKVLAIVTKYDGKQITKRIANDFAKANPQYEIHWDDYYSFFNLEIWGGDTGHNKENRLSFTIGHKNLLTNTALDVDLTKFPASNGRFNSASIERNKLRTELLNDDMRLATIAKALNDYKDAHDRIEKLTQYPFTERYTFTKLVDYK